MRDGAHRRPDPYYSLMRIPLSLAVLGLALSACYRYVPSADIQPATGDDVKLTLSPDASVRLAPVLGERTRSVTGRILSDGASELTLAVDRTFKDDSVAVVWAGDRVTIPRNAIILTERRVLDRKRTLMSAGAVVVSAVVTAIVLSKSRASGGSSGDDPPGTTPP